MFLFKLSLSMKNHWVGRLVHFWNQMKLPNKALRLSIFLLKENPPPFFLFTLQSQWFSSQGCELNNSFGLYSCFSYEILSSNPTTSIRKLRSHSLCHFHFMKDSSLTCCSWCFIFISCIYMVFKSFSNQQTLLSFI